MTESCDTVLNVCNSFGYDEFNRLTARTVNQGTAQNFTYTFDRYGNRWAQNAPQGGPTLNISFNKANNIINVAGFYNDLVGNVTGDTFHSYFYDADGNLTSVDNGQTAKYYYDSLNQRVQIAPARGTYEFVWDIFGRRVSNWSASSHSFVESNAYTDSGPIAIRAAGQTQFEHQNWLGTERVRTSYNGAVVLSITSLPWADQHTPAGDNGDQHDFAGTDRDLETNSEHAKHRQFSTNLGRWLSPDQYLGSYDLNNPQSFNRYSYALNNPANFVDPSGLDTVCVTDPDTGDLSCTISIPSLPYPTPPPSFGDGCSNQPWLCWMYPGGGSGPRGGTSGGTGGGSGGALSYGPLHLALLSAPSKSYLGKVKCNVQGELSIARQDGVALGLDVAGFFPGESTASAVAQYAIATASMFNSAFHGDGGGAKLGAGGELIAIVSGVQSTMGPATWAKAIPIVGYIANTAAFVNDLTSAYAHGSQAYSACINAPD